MGFETPTSFENGTTNSLKVNAPATVVIETVNGSIIEFTQMPNMAYKVTPMGDIKDIKTLIHDSEAVDPE